MAGFVLAYVKLFPVLPDMIWDALMFLGRYGHQDITKLENWPLSKVYYAAESLARVMKREGKGGSFNEASVSGGA